MSDLSIDAANRMLRKHARGEALQYLAVLDAEVEFYRGKEWHELLPGTKVLITAADLKNCTVTARDLSDLSFKREIDPCMLYDFEDTEPRAIPGERAEG